jgi:hypothetical protein
MLQYIEINGSSQKTNNKKGDTKMKAMIKELREGAVLLAIASLLYGGYTLSMTLYFGVDVAWVIAISLSFLFNTGFAAYVFWKIGRILKANPDAIYEAKAARLKKICAELTKVNSDIEYSVYKVESAVDEIIKNIEQ